MSPHFRAAAGVEWADRVHSTLHVLLLCPPLPLRLVGMFLLCLRFTGVFGLRCCRCGSLREEWCGRNGFGVEALSVDSLFASPLRGETIKPSDGAMRVAVPGGLAFRITSTFDFDQVRRLSLASSTA